MCHFESEWKPMGEQREIFLNVVKIMSSTRLFSPQVNHTLLNRLRVLHWNGSIAYCKIALEKSY